MIETLCKVVVIGGFVMGIVIVIVMGIGHTSSLSMDLATVTTSSKRTATAKPTESEDETNSRWLSIKPNKNGFNPHSCLGKVPIWGSFTTRTDF